MTVRQKILVTGANGQLGQCLRELSEQHPLFEFAFFNREEFPIDDESIVRDTLQRIQPQYIINAAAYTAVDKAESDSDNAFKVNADGPALLAGLAKEIGARIIHISTDYVFAGDKQEPYLETDTVAPQGVYGESKLTGEKRVMDSGADAIIIRTAWVYSTYGNNFVKTMKRLMSERPEINVVNDQIGAPTYAIDLADAILKIIAEQKWESGLYHYSNTGRISWYDFAVAIRDLTESQCKVNPVTSEQFKTIAKRPSYSLLDTSKFQQTFSLPIRDWKEALKEMLAIN